MRLNPTPPKDVRLTLADGREIPVECVHVGVIDGLDHWRVVTPFAGSVRMPTAAMWPARSTIEIELPEI